ncbi:hypothetical protein ISF_10027 [Cordyceps fumosorosea ARSEF 2679]|uniref:Uncharacterized protein n=1 Tax=Cordyceps fumosorosea (strain ARSEF 2679) TaxID=1081104 RepID=A0A166VXB8_CORFA|nr:hypothetical protein ISF_10027 [Cordyceps fumosorosea ARSEF 2679]OAA34131.1 hypothetical protein ISF_10027 [Cordyceps fumosorosea ARSEF 2679]
MARQLPKIQAHFRTRHGWKNSRNAGRPDLKRKRSPADEEGGVNVADTPIELHWRENVPNRKLPTLARRRSDAEPMREDDQTTNDTSRLIRCWLVTSKLNSYQANAFSVMTEPSTRYRYRQTWKKFIAFVVREWLLPSRIRRQVKVALSLEIQREIQLLWEHQLWNTPDMTTGKWPNILDRRYSLDVQHIPTLEKDVNTAEYDMEPEGNTVDDSGYNSAEETDWESDTSATEYNSEADEDKWPCTVQPEKSSRNHEHRTRCGSTVLEDQRRSSS